MEIKDIGKIEGKWLVFGGPYSNLQALEGIWEVANDKGIPPEKIICTGDVVGYCAQPEEAVQFVKKWGIHAIAGNVEKQVREGKEDCGCNFREASRCDRFSRNWYPFAQQQVSEDSVEWMKDLPGFLSFSMGRKKGLVVHGAFSGISKYIFPSTPWKEKKKEFLASGRSIIIGGHSGIPFLEGKNGLYWLNAGVTGMPANDGTCRAWYLVVDADSREAPVSLEHFYFKNEKAARLIEQRSLPVEYAKTLKTGLWDNCEILPEEETYFQGKAIKNHKMYIDFG